MEHQVASVRAALTEAVPLVPVVCFVDSDWGLFASPLRFGAIRVLWPKVLYKLVQAAGELGPPDIARLERELATALPPA
jgi:hypothetical protein